MHGNLPAAGYGWRLHSARLRHRARAVHQSDDSSEADYFTGDDSLNNAHGNRSASGATKSRTGDNGPNRYRASSTAFAHGGNRRLRFCRARSSEDIADTLLLTPLLSALTRRLAAAISLPDCCIAIFGFGQTAARVDENSRLLAGNVMS